MEWTQADRLSPTGQKLITYLKRREVSLLIPLRKLTTPNDETQFIRGQLHEQEVFLREFLKDESSNS